MVDQRRGVRVTGSRPAVRSSARPPIPRILRTAVAVGELETSPDDVVDAGAQARARHDRAADRPGVEEDAIAQVGAARSPAERRVARRTRLDRRGGFVSGPIAALEPTPS